MRLYTFLHSPNPLKVRLALAELEIAYEAFEVHLFKDEHRGDEFTVVNPHRKVPVLDDGGFILRESNAILSYLGRTYGQRSTGGLWPGDPREEAHAMQWLFFESVHLAMQCGTVWWTDVVAPAIGKPGAHEEVVKDAAYELERSLDLLEGHLRTPYLLGDALTLPDCSVGVAVAMLQHTRLDKAERWPRVANYRNRIRHRPTWVAARGDAIHVFG